MTDEEFAMQLQMQENEAHRVRMQSIALPAAPGRHAQNMSIEMANRQGAGDAAALAPPETANSFVQPEERTACRFERCANKRSGRCLEWPNGAECVS